MKPLRRPSTPRTPPTGETPPRHAIVIKGGQRPPKGGQFEEAVCLARHGGHTYITAQNELQLFCIHCGAPLDWKSITQWEKTARVDHRRG